VVAKYQKNKLTAIIVNAIALFFASVLGSPFFPFLVLLVLQLVLLLPGFIGIADLIRPEGLDGQSLLMLVTSFLPHFNVSSLLPGSSNDLLNDHG
jgi:hypothetical protein